MSNCDNPRLGRNFECIIKEFWENWFNIELHHPFILKITAGAAIPAERKYDLGSNTSKILELIN